MFVKVGTAAVERVLDKEEFHTRVADRKIVEYDPEYVYVVVRALSADRPNSNGDCFPHEELIRLDPVLHRPVYASFIGKGVYINHQHTDDPRYAKGIILDSRYVQSNTEDKYVELLLGIDKQKDPVFARDVERGLINKFSMGASVQFTKCSVCDNQARRKEEFCEHIAKHKMRECKAEDGSKKLAYENCFGVTYNEISAVSDPADETAQLLHRIAKSTSGAEKRSGTTDSANTSHGTVVMMNDIRAGIKRLEALIMANRTKTAAPLPSAAPTPGPAAGGAPMGDPMAQGAGDDLMMEDAGPAEGGPVVEVLKIVEDLVSGALPAADAVQAIEQAIGGDPNSPEAAPGEELGAPEPPPTDMAGPTANSKSFNAWLKRVSTTLEKRNMATKTAEEKSPKVDNQYPYDKRQKDPKQFPNPAHDSRHESRPASDFDSDTKEYGKLTNVSAEFVSNKDRRLAGWRITDGDRAIAMVTGGNAWGPHLNEQYDRFASRDYGVALVSAILEDGLDATLQRVKAIKVGDETPKAATVLDNDKLLKAAEAKAADLAQEQNEDFVVRFIEGIKLALKLQDKNVFPNTIKGAAWEVLTAAGLDGKLAERIASGPVVEAHVDEAIRKALEYSEMSVEAFEEVKAQAEVMSARSVTASVEHGAETISEEEALAAMQESAREHLTRRASRNAGAIRMGQPGETPGKTYANSISEAVRAGNSSISPRPTKPLSESYGKRPAA